MLRIAIVEDEVSFAKTELLFCDRYSQQTGEEISAVHFDNPYVFLQKYHGDYDLVLMDILMPQLNGMECARRLRKLDENVMLCFVTSIAQYAVQGYEVGALDFILKPVNYDEFSMKLDRFVRLQKRQSSASILVSSRNEVRKIEVRDLCYVEVYNHSLIYHTLKEDFEAYGKLSMLEEDERFSGFIRISPSYLVNCAHVITVGAEELNVNGAILPVSRRRRKECLEKIAVILGGRCY